MLGSERPIIADLRRTGVDNALELISVLALVYMLAFTYTAFASLPDLIPTHFNASGEADRWGGKNGIWLIPVLGTAMYVFLTVLNRFPQKFNFPVPITEANARTQYMLARQLVSAVKASTLCTFAYITWARIQVAMELRDGLGSSFLPTVVPITL